MKQTLNTSIEKINHLDRKSLEQYLITEQSLPNSDEKIFNIGYALLKLDCLDEAFSFLRNYQMIILKNFFLFLKNYQIITLKKLIYFLLDIMKVAMATGIVMMIAVITMITMTMIAVLILFPIQYNFPASFKDDLLRSEDFDLFGIRNGI